MLLDESLARPRSHAISPHASRWHMEAARKQREDEVFVELAQTLNASLDLDAVLQRVVEAAQ